MVNSNGNQYFETLNRSENEFNEEALVHRMSECNMVLGEISKSQAWKILIDDVRSLMKTLDDNWQHIPPGSDKFESARVMKMACSVVSDFPSKYLKELESLEEKLVEIQNADKIIQKDADN